MKKLFILFSVLFFLAIAIPASAIDLLGSGIESGAAGCSGNYGDTDITGSTQQNCGTGAYSRVRKITLDCAGTPASISNYLYLNANKDIVSFIYADNAGAPGALLWWNQHSEAVGTSWKVESGVTCPLTAGDYHAGFQAQGNADRYFWDTCASGIGHYHSSGTFGVPPAGGDFTASTRAIQVYLNF